MLNKKSWQIRPKKTKTKKGELHESHLGVCGAAETKEGRSGEKGLTCKLLWSIGPYRRSRRVAALSLSSSRSWWEKWEGEY